MRMLRHKVNKKLVQSHTAYKKKIKKTKPCDFAVKFDFLKGSFSVQTQKQQKEHAKGIRKLSHEKKKKTQRVKEDWEGGGGERAGKEV